MDIQATKQRINTIGERLASLSNEAECGFAELSKLATILADELAAASEALEGSGEAIRHMVGRAVGYRKERDQTLADLQTSDSERAELDQKCKRLKAENDRMQIIALRSNTAEDYLDAKKYIDDAELLTKQLGPDMSLGNKVAWLLGRWGDLERKNKALVLERDNAIRVGDVNREVARAMAQERDKWTADFRDLNYRATQLQGDVDRLKQELAGANDSLSIILSAADTAEGIAGHGTREEAIRATADVMRAIFADAEHGVMLPTVLDCPYGEPYHDHSDGCPCCVQVEVWAGEIAAKALSDMKEFAWGNPGYRWTPEDIESVKQTISRCLQERRVYPRSEPKVVPGVTSNEVEKQEVQSAEKPMVDNENGIIDVGKGPMTVSLAGHQLKGFVHVDDDGFIRIKRGPDDESVPGATVAEWHRMRDYMQGGRAEAITEERVLDMITEEFARVKANGGFDRIMTEDRVREIISEEMEPKLRSILTFAKIADVVIK